MPHPLKIPELLRRGPFTLDEAKLSGLERWHLEGTRWRRLGPRTYVSSGISETPLLLLQAASRRMPPAAAFSGLTAAWLHGLDVTPCDPIEITAPKSEGVASRSGMIVRRANLGEEDVVLRRGLRATRIARTLREVGCRLTLTESVVLCDEALHSRLVPVSELKREAMACAGARGITTFRDGLEHLEPASESRMETRLRMLLVLAGLPRPSAQYEIRDRWMRFVGRLDLYYPEQRLGLEYDGAVHRDRMADDNRRQNRLFEAGVRLLRFTAGDIINTPELVISQVQTALRARVNALA